MKKQIARKPFVEPKVIEQASLANVTMVSGGNPPVSTLTSNHGQHNS